MKTNSILLCFGVSLLLFYGCEHEEIPQLTNLSADSPSFKNITCNQDTAYFYNDVGPLIITNCAIKGCHDGNSGHRPALTNYANILKSVVPGQMDQSKLYKSLVKTGDNIMPKAPIAAFSAAQILLVGKWIQQGAKNNGCFSEMANCDLKNVTYANSVVPILQSSCSACHGATNYTSAGGGYRLNTYADFADFAKSGLLMNSINNIGVPNGMPKGSNKLSACNIAKIGIVVQKIIDSLNTSACETTHVTYPSTILPILQTYCIACHSTENSASAGGGYRLTTYSDFSDFAKSGLLMNSINNIGVPNGMPKGSNKLSACNIAKIGIAVQQIIDSVKTGVCDISNVTYPSTTLPIMQTYCLVCHSTTNAASAGGGFKLSTYSDFSNYAKNGLLMNSINNIGVPNGMPKGNSKLSDCNITKIGISVQKIIDSLKSVACDVSNVTYPSTILPILQTYCLACHSNASAASAGGGFRLATYPDFLAFAKSGLLMNAVNNVGVPNGMPKGGNKLSACNLTKLGIMVKRITDSLNAISCDTTNVTFPVTISPIMQSYCLACHSTANAANSGAGYKLETLTDFSAIARTGLVMNSINQVAGLSPMPKGGNKLSACNIAKIGIFVRTLGGGMITPPPVSSCSPDTVYYTNTLGPLIVSNCAMVGCHNGAGPSPTLLTYANIRRQVTPGAPSTSRLYTVLNGGEEPMPPGTPFTASQKLIVYKWIQQGAKNNSCVDAFCDVSNVTYSLTVSSIISINCLGCHGATANTKLNSYTNVKATVISGKLSGAIQHQPGFLAMPPGGTLSVCDINKINAWINNGALNN